MGNVGRAEGAAHIRDVRKQLGLSTGRNRKRLVLERRDRIDPKLRGLNRDRVLHSRFRIEPEIWRGLKAAR